MKTNVHPLGIKGKLTILISVSIFALVFIFLIFLVLVGKNQKEAEIKQSLINAIETNAQKIRFKNNLISLDNTYIFKNNIYTSIYDENHNFIYGETPMDFPLYTDFETGRLKNVSQFYIYDLPKNIQGKKIIVRGIVSFASAKQTFNSLFYLVLTLLPVLALITILLARLFIRKAFMPVEHIIHVAQEIQNSKDLSLRIRLDSKTKDEIHALAHTFDSMFNSLESAFIKEKQFTSDASHELRTPTSVIIAQCELALENLDNTPQNKEIHDALKTILWNAKKMSQMTSQLLLLTKAEHNADILEHEEINLSELAEIIAEQQQELAEEKGISVSCSIQEGIWFTGDSTLLTSALINLFSNAIKYNKGNGKINFSLTANEENILGKISDTGIGISEENLPKIWERFYRVDKARNKKQGEYNGTGLGLPLVKWIFEAHGGSITASSSLGKGTIFLFSLPKTQNTAKN